MRNRRTGRYGGAVCAAVLAVTACVLVDASACAAADYVILVDCTGTMRYQGKAEATLNAVGEFIEAASPGDFVTVYGYGEDPFPALAEYPVRIEQGDAWDSLSELVRLPFAADRTDITKGLELAWSERDLVLPHALHQAAGTRGLSCVVLLTDGKLIPCYDDYSEYGRIYAASRSRLLELGTLFGQAGIPIYSVGLGSEEKVDGALLKELSKRSGGSYIHSPTSVGLVGAFDTLMSDVMDAGRPESKYTAVAAPAEPEEAALGMQARKSESEVDVVAAQTPPTQQADRVDAGTGWMSEAAVAGIHGSDPDRSRTPGGLGASAARAAFKDIASTVHQTVLGVLGVVVGFVAIGVQRKQSWTRAFTKPLLRKEIRVKGYLRPTYPDGVVGVRCCLPIENPGLPTVELGEGTEFAQDIPGVLVEVVGTVDGTPPTLRVMKGEVRVNGSVIEDERRLEDGDIVDLNGCQYTYLRGCRR